jgi:hypothetical protein
MRYLVVICCWLPTLVIAAPDAGDRVLAVWGPDGFYYPGRVQTLTDGGVAIAFDDGDVATVRPDQLRPIDWKVGTELQCNFRNQGKYYPARIARMRGETISIAYADGDNEQATISRCRSR